MQMKTWVLSIFLCLANACLYFFFFAVLMDGYFVNRFASTMGVSFDSSFIILQVAVMGARQFAIGSIVLRFLSSDKISAVPKAYLLTMLVDAIGLGLIFYGPGTILSTFPMLSIIYIVYPATGVWAVRNFARTSLAKKISFQPMLVFLIYIVIACGLWICLALKMAFN